MGLYSIPGFGSSHTLDVAQLLPDAPADTLAAAPAALADAGAATAADGVATQPAIATGMSQGPAAAAGCLRLYQILAPRLLERAHLYGNKLQLKPGSTLHDLPFFAAPGTTSASLIDQLLQQSSDFGALYKHGSGSVKGSKVVSSRVLQGVFDRQQPQRLPQMLPQTLPPPQQQQQGLYASGQQEMLGAAQALLAGATQQEKQATAGQPISKSVLELQPAGSSQGAVPAAAAAAAATGSVDASRATSLWLLPSSPVASQSVRPLLGGSSIAAAEDASVLTTYVFCTVILPAKAR
jgi:hypothetical protein